MVSSHIPSGPSDVAFRTARQQRLEIQAARHAACFRADPDQSDSAPTPTNFPIFLHGPLAHPNELARVLGTTPPPPTLTPARILDADSAQSVLTVMPLLEAYYSNKCEATFVPIRADGRIMLAAACMWTGRPAPVTTRRLFFCGLLKDSETLGKVLKAPPGHVFDLALAVLEGWRVRRGDLVPGGDSERVEGCTYECAGRLIPLIEDYYGERHAPVEVTVDVSRVGGRQERVRAWCYVRDELREDDPAT